MPDSLKYNRNFYNGSNSSTASRWDGQSFGVAYGAGSLHGLVWQDTVWVDNIGVGGNPIECAQVSPILLGKCKLSRSMVVYLCTSQANEARTNTHSMG